MVIKMIKTRRKNPPSQTQINLAGRLKKLRLNHGLSLQEVADKVGISKVTLLRYETLDITNIPSNNIEKLADIYKTTPSYIMGWDDERNIRNKIEHEVNISTNEKPTLIKKILKRIESGLDYENVAKILDFPEMEKAIFKMIFDEDLLNLARIDKEIFDTLTEAMLLSVKEVFKKSNLTFTEDDAEINMETFEQIINKKNLTEIIEEELKKYKDENKLTSNIKFLDQEEFISVPVYGKASAGNGYINMEKILYNKTIHINGYSHNSFLIEVSGDSMEHTISDGEYVLVDPAQTNIFEDKVYVVTYNNETFIKLIEKHENAGIAVLKSRNPEYKDIIIRDEEFENIKIEGRVVKVISERNL